MYLHPPLSIFVVEKRAFGRTVMVGTHIVSHIMKFAPQELDVLEEEMDTPSKSECLSSEFLYLFIYQMYIPLFATLMRSTKAVYNTKTTEY